MSMKIRLMIVFEDEHGEVYVLDVSLCKSVLNILNTKDSSLYPHPKIAAIKFLRTSAQERLTLKIAKGIVDALEDGGVRMDAIRTAQPKEKEA